jgi:hypothetical protein
MNEMLEAMRESPSPLLQLLSQTIGTLYYSTESPPEFPYWIKKTVPLVVTVNKDKISEMNFIATIAKVNAFSALDQSSGQTVPLHGLRDVGLSIHLGLPGFNNYYGSEGLVDSTYLTKETIQLLGVIPTVEGLTDIFKERGVSVIKPDGSQIGDEEKTEAGLALLGSLSLNKGSQVWKAFDALPIAVVANEINSLVNKYPELKQNQGLKSFNTAAQILGQNPAAREKITSLVAEWATSQTLLPPPNYLRSTFDENVAPILEKIYDVIFSYGVWRPMRKVLVA